MGTRVRRLTSWLASPRTAVVLLLLVGVWSFLGTLVPQGIARDARVVAWRMAHPTLGPMVAATGFHQAFSSPVFIVMVLLLAASTAVCSWRRTRAAVRRHRLLLNITDEEALSLSLRPTFTVDVEADGPPEPLQAASGALRAMGLRTTQRDGLVVATSRPWAVFGSPVFHWSLLLLIVVILSVSLTRAEGLIGVPEGDSRPLTARSFGLLKQGWLYRFEESPDRVRVDKMNVVYIVDGIDRGPAPTVSIVRPDGSVAISQVVYPNNPLRYGSLIIHPSAIGLSPGFALISREGSESARSNLMVDFAEDAPEGTSPADFTLTATAPENSIEGSVTVPLVKRAGEFVQAVPDPPRAAFALTKVGGAPVADTTLSVGQELALPDGSRLRLLGVGYYARLSVVDDPSIPIVYTLLLVALVGVSVSILGRQSLAVATLSESETGGVRVAVWFRDWRSNAVRSAQAEEAVRDAMCRRSGKSGDTE